MKENNLSRMITSSIWSVLKASMPALFFVLLHPHTAAAHLSTTTIVSRYDIIITEIMADPSPPAALPEYEYIELKNISGKPIDLIGCKLATENNSASFSRSIILPPDSFLICCSNTAALSLQQFGKAIGLSAFPSLGNETGIIQLISPQSNIIHAVSWQPGWHRNPIKAKGGWSLEMISTAQYCTGAANWAASMDERGGTPGRTNSIDADLPDELAPALLRTYTTDSLHIIAIFDEPVDSTGAASPANFRLEGIQPPLLCQSMPPLFTEVQIRLPAAMQEQQVFKLSVSNLRDCHGNSVGMINTAKAGRASPASAGDIVINEILPDPPPDGDDFAELLNTGKKIIELSTLYFSNRNSAQALINSKPVSPFPFLLFPGDYLAICSTPEWLGQKYLLKDRSAILGVNSLPSLPNEEGILVLSNTAAQIIDEVSYNAGWHFPLLQSAEGISLERIDPLRAASQNNFMSAATTAGGGTPGYVNSQYKSLAAIQGSFQLASKSFSPDLDGHDDLLHIQYQMNAPGAAGTIQVFDMEGNLIRKIAVNALLGITGSFSWDGLGENKQPLPTGIYIIHASWFNTNGISGKWKEGVVLARRN